MQECFADCVAAWQYSRWTTGHVPTTPPTMTYQTPDQRSEGRADPYADQVCALVRVVASRCPSLERAASVGGGTGWITAVLADTFTSALEVDPAIEPLPPPGDLTVSCETVEYEDDQRAFFVRCRELTRPGGRLLVFTENPFVCERERLLSAASPPRRRLSREAISEHCRAVGFRLDSITTIDPAGDLGVLRWRRKAQGALRRLIDSPPSTIVFERLGLGRILVVEAVAVPIERGEFVEAWERSQRAYYAAIPRILRSSVLRHRLG